MAHTHVTQGVAPITHHPQWPGFFLEEKQKISPIRTSKWKEKRQRGSKPMLILFCNLFYQRKHLELLLKKRVLCVCISVLPTWLAHNGLRTPLVRKKISAQQQQRQQDWKMNQTSKLSFSRSLFLTHSLSLLVFSQAFPIFRTTVFWIISNVFQYNEENICSRQVLKHFAKF